MLEIIVAADLAGTMEEAWRNMGEMFRGESAGMERFSLNRKMARARQQDHANHSEALREVNECIVGFRNSSRLHSPAAPCR